MNARDRTDSKDRILVIRGKDKTDSVAAYRYVGDKYKVTKRT